MLGAFSDTAPETHAAMWDMVLSYSRVFPGSWHAINARKAVLPRLSAFLRCSAPSVMPCLAPFGAAFNVLQAVKPQRMQAYGCIKTYLEDVLNMLSRCSTVCDCSRAACTNLAFEFIRMTVGTCSHHASAQSCAS